MAGVARATVGVVRATIGVVGVARAMVGVARATANATMATADTAVATGGRGDGDGRRNDGVVALSLSRWRFLFQGVGVVSEEVAGLETFLVLTSCLLPRLHGVP